MFRFYSFHRAGLLLLSGPQLIDLEKTQCYDFYCARREENVLKTRAVTYCTSAYTWPQFQWSRNGRSNGLQVMISTYVDMKMTSIGI